MNRLTDPDVGPVDEPWEQLRSRLRIGEYLTGTVVRVPKPGVIGIFIDLGLSAGGFVDVLLLPRDPGRWPAEGTVTDFEIWWMDERPQIRLKPVESAYLMEDFDCWVAQENSVAAKQWLQRAGETHRGV